MYVHVHVTGFFTQILIIVRQARNSFNIYNTCHDGRRHTIRLNNPHPLRFKRHTFTRIYYRQLFLLKTLPILLRIHAEVATGRGSYRNMKKRLNIDLDRSPRAKVGLTWTDRRPSTYRQIASHVIGRVVGLLRKPIKTIKDTRRAGKHVYTTKLFF